MEGKDIEKQNEEKVSGDTLLTTKANQDDPELNQLLDSALDDFDKPLIHSSNSQNPPKQVDVQCTNLPGLPKPDSQVGEGSEGERGQELADLAQFEDVLKAFLDEPKIKEEFEKLNLSDATGSDDDFAASLAETLKNLTENTQSLSDHPTEEELSRLLGMTGEEGSGAFDSDLSNILPLMQNVMQNLLSKDLLYPALKDIHDKYPGWLAEKQSSLSKEELDRYTNQSEYMRQVCEEFEAESSSDSEEVKKHRFNKILNLMQKMQECGHPPKEIVSESASPLEFGSDGLPKIHGERCSIM